MRSLFSRDSPHRLRGNGSREDRGDTSANSNNNINHNNNSNKRRSFAFMKYSPDRRSSASMKASRERASQIAKTLSQHEPSSEQAVAARSSNSRGSVPERSAAGFDDFNPFGHDMGAAPSPNISTAPTTSTSRSSSKRRSKPTATAAAIQQQQQQPQEDFFAQASQEDFFAQAPAAPAPRQSRKGSTASSSASGSGFQQDFDNNSNNDSFASGAAYDMDFLPQPPQRESAAQRRVAQRGRPPRNNNSKATGGSEVSFGSMSSSSQLQWPSAAQSSSTTPPPVPQHHHQQHQQQLQQQHHQQSKSMSTFPSNSSMQSSFAGSGAPVVVSHTPPPSQQLTPPPSVIGSGGGGAAARRRMRSSMRHSSNSSLGGSDSTSLEGGTPPASPMSGRRMLSTSNSNGNASSVGSSNGGGAQQQQQQRNRVTSYTISGNNTSSWQHSPSPSMRGSGGGGASVCSSVAESDVDLFDSQNAAGGFTFDAFGLDASEIEREVQEAMQAISGTGNSSSNNSNRGNIGGAAASSNSSFRGGGGGDKLQDISGDDFEPQAWDSPPGSRRSTPVPKEQLQEEDDGFVDGFRISKPSPLPQISVHRQSSPGSERSSSLSSITDNNTDHGVPRRNVFKEKAGFMSSNSNNGRPRPSPAQPTKKEWVPPPGAVKMLTPPRHDVNERRQQQQPASTEEETDNFWNSHLNQIDDMLKVGSDGQPQQHQEPQQHQVPARQRQQQQQQPGTPTESSASATPSMKNKWQSAAAKYGPPSSQQQPGMPQPSKKYSREASFRKQQQEEKKDEDENSEDRDNHTDTTSAMTTVISEPQPPSPGQPRQVARRMTLETDLLEDESKLKEKALSPQELRKRELEDLRNGNASASSSAFKSQARMMGHVNQEGNTLKPQQKRADECNNQRTSFASFRERLKSPIEQQNKMAGSTATAPQQQQQSAFFASQISPQSAKSEVGVSSFTRQKNRIASFSSASKSEVGYGKSPRNQQQPELNAVMNRMREKNLNSACSTPNNSGISPTAESSTPAFMAVKLRKSPTPPALQPNNSNEVSGSVSMDSHENRKLSYRERREMELRELQEQEQAPPRFSPSNELMSQAQKIAMQQESGFAQEQTRAESPRRLSYRERRELELTKQREMNHQQVEAEHANDAPKRDVADLIRRRVAANKTKGVTSPESESSQQTTPMGRERLRPSGFAAQDGVEPAISSDSDRYGAPRDEVTMDHTEYGARQEKGVSFEIQDTISPRHSEPPPRQDQQESQPSASSSAGGLSALHTQLKQMKDLQPADDPEEPMEAQSAPRRATEGRPDFSKLEVTATHSQSSDPHSSPTRTPKATYAMLNAFLHGREAISAHDETPAKPNPEELEDDGSASEGSPPKSSMVTASAGTMNDGRDALKDDPKYARYFTMLKIGMPLDVVKHAMIRDNVDPNVMDGDHNRPACAGGIPLKDDSKYSKYFKMLKIGMPMEAVKHSMERDGLDSHVMDQDHNLPADPNKVEKDEGPKEQDSHRRARLHWKPLGQVRRNSLWAKIDEDLDLDNIEIDEEEFAELFQSEIHADSEHTKKGKTIKSPRKGAAVRVIDPKRANNGGIILARLKMSHDDMADVVDRIDENGMTGEQIEHIIQYLPTNDERRALEAYMLEGGQDAAEKFDGLCECEKFMVSMMTVKHAKRKVRALLFKLQFESCLENLYQETHTVETSCDELSNSVRLRQLLGIVLTFGNRLNTVGKGKKKKAGAFTLDSLLKLNQAKAFDKKTTFLSYIVQIVQRNNELLLRFRDDLPTVFKADKVFWDQCIADLEEVENQLENVRKIALYQARQAAKFRRRKHKHQEGGDDDEESLSDMSLSLEEEVEALRSSPIGLFTLSAIKKVSFLRDRVENTKIKFHKLLEYFGEDEKQMQPHELFNIIVKFCRDFDKAKEQVFADEKKKKREERKRQSISSNGQTPNAKTPGKPPQHNHGMVRLSSMQPNASRLIEDMKRNSPAFSRQEAPPQAREEAQQTRPPAPVSQYQQAPADPNSVPRREAAPLVSPPRPSAETSVQISRHSANVPVESSPRHAVSVPGQSSPKQSAGGQSFGLDVREMHHAAERVAREPQVSPNRPVARPAPPSSPEPQPMPPPQGVIPRGTQEQGRMEQSYDRGMQEKGRMEHSYDSGMARTEHSYDSGMASNDVTSQHHQDRQELDTSMSSETGSAALRRKARMRGRRRTGVSPPEDSPEDPPAYPHVVPPMDTQSSAPLVTAPPSDHDRRSSLPLENSNGVANSTGPSSPSMSSSLMRNKLRSKRMLERKQRVLGRQSPPPPPGAC